MAISAHILKIVEKDPFLRLQMRANEMFNRHQFFVTGIDSHLGCYLSDLNAIFKSVEGVSAQSYPVYKVIKPRKYCNS